MLALPHFHADDNRARIVVFTICLILTGRYIGWRFAATLPPLALSAESIYAWGFSTIEALANVGWAICFVTMSRTLDRQTEVEAGLYWLTRLEDLPKVDVLIPTYNEDEAILSRTITGALDIDFPEVRVWVLDDGKRKWLSELCARKGVRYLSRPSNRHAKAGNINHALAVIHDTEDPPEFVAIFDADFVPFRQFLWRTIPLFEQADVGIVQTPQAFFNPDPIQANLILGKVWPDEQRFFFEHVLPSKDAWGAAFCCGTSSVIRIAALEEIGRFPTDSVTEDFLLTLCMDRGGWRTIYLNETLSVGLAPEGMKEYLTQRGRWCLGLMQILRSPFGPFSSGHLSLSYRIALVNSFLYWAMSFSFKLLCLLAPVVYWFTGLTVGSASAADTINYFLPYYATVMITFGWVTSGKIQPLLTDVAHLLTMPEALKAVFVGLLKPRERPFKITAKGLLRDRAVIQWNLILPYALIAGLTLAGMLYGSVADFAPERHGPGASAIMIFWSIYNVIALMLTIAVCVELPHYRREERFATSETVQVSVRESGVHRAAGRYIARRRNRSGCLAGKIA